MGLQNPYQAAIGLRPVADANVTVDPTVIAVFYTSISAARTVTLQLAQSFNPAQPLVVLDASGSASGTNTITIVPSGSDLINGASSVVIAEAYGGVVLYPNGGGGWFYAAGSNSSSVVITGGTINGTTIGGTTPAAGTFTQLAATGFIDESVGSGLTATGTSRTNALQLTKQINDVTTVASGTGVILPAISTAGVGAAVVVFNDGANVLQVYGSGTNTIDTVAGATGVPLTNTKRCIYFALTASTWISAQLGVISA